MAVNDTNMCHSKLDWHSRHLGMPPSPGEARSNLLRWPTYGFYILTRVVTFCVFCTLINIYQRCVVDHYLLGHISYHLY